MSYTEGTILAALARHTFAGALMCVDNCCRLGSECDLLVVTKKLRCIDVEVKISRADLKADGGKDKWFQPQGWHDHGRPRVTRHWPDKVWKHYYCVAEPVWRDDLLEHCQPMSGVFVITLYPSGTFRGVKTIRRAKANPAQQPASIELVRDLARLTSIRLWESRRCNEKEAKQEVAA